MTKTAILFLLFSGILGLLPGQNIIRVRFVPLDKDTAFFSGKISTFFEAGDTVAAFSEIRRAVQLFREQSYLEAAADSIAYTDTLWTAFIHTGPAYLWVKLRNGNIDPFLLEQSGYRERLFSDKPLDYHVVNALFEKILSWAENNGYPFASVWLDSVEVTAEGMAAALMLDKNRFMLFDEVSIKGNAKISKVYLENYLGIRHETLYSKQKVLAISNRLKELPFLFEKQKPTVTFRGERATINLFLERKKASRFDFLIGVAPNNNPLLPGKILLTGTFSADFYNQFGAGERLSLEFQRLRPQTQKLDVRLSYPYILDFPFGVDTRLELYKRDSTNLDASGDLGFQYLLEGGNYVRIFWNNVTSSLLKINTAKIIAQKKLPESLDVQRNFFGLEFFRQQLDYRWNPRRGWSVWARGAAGIKRIKKNTEILQLQDPENVEFDFETLYDTLTLKSGQYKIETKLEKYFPTGSQTALKIAAQGGMLLSSQPIYQNEQYRIGGHRLLRGFDEESIFATRYVVGTLEYRLLLGQNSFLYAFFDAAYVENLTPEIQLFDHPMGLGAGISFETTPGIFGVSLAVGSQQGAGFDFRSVKTHFGYVSLF